MNIITLLPVIIPRTYGAATNKVPTLLIVLSVRLDIWGVLTLRVVNHISQYVGAQELLSVT